MDSILENNKFILFYSVLDTLIVNMHVVIQFITITHAFPLTIIKALLKVMMNKYLLTYLLA